MPPRQAADSSRARDYLLQFDDLRRAGWAVTCRSLVRVDGVGNRSNDVRPGLPSRGKRVRGVTVAVHSRVDEACTDEAVLDPGER